MQHHGYWGALYWVCSRRLTVCCQHQERESVRVLLAYDMFWTGLNSRHSLRTRQINQPVASQTSQRISGAQESNSMPGISSPHHPSAAASRMGSELPRSRSVQAEEASLPDNPEDEERNGLEIASAALGRPEKIGEIHFYAGKKEKNGRKEQVH